MLLVAECWWIGHTHGQHVVPRVFFKTAVLIATSSENKCFLLFHIFSTIRLLFFFNLIYLFCCSLINNEVKNFLSCICWPIMLSILWNTHFCLLLIFYFVVCLFICFIGIHSSFWILILPWLYILEIFPPAL